jgi:LuxR family maltose regulon positive regulatory protein
MIILESDLRIPNYSPYLIRNRLFSYLENHLDRSLICLTSEGGYGKTTLLSSFLQERNIPAIWYQLSRQDRNPLSFLSNMKTAIERQISGENVAANLCREKMGEELDQIIAILSTWPTRLIIVLDHYHSVHQCEEIENMLTSMISYASPSVTFMIASRIRPNLQLVNLKLKNKFTELTTKDLAFTREEISQFFTRMHQLNLDDYEIDLIHRKTEGWAIGLQFLQDAIKNMNKAERASFWMNFNGTPDMNDYFSSGILDSQPSEIRDFLYMTSLLTELNSDVINKYLGIEQAGEILEYLLHHHLFVYRTNAGSMKYHNLFRSFLFREFAKRFSKDEINEFHHKLAGIYERKSDFVNAFAHSLVGGHSMKASELMKSMKERFHASQFLALIDRLSEYVFPDFSSAGISLFLFRCIPTDILADLVALMEVHFKGIENRSNPLLPAYVAHQLAAIYFYLGDLNKSYQMCGYSLKESIKLNDHEMIVKNRSLKSLLSWRMGKYEEAERFARENLADAGSASDFYTRQLSLWVMSESYLERNQLSKAESFIKETMKLAEDRSDSSPLFSFYSMAKYYRLKGEPDKALAWIQNAENVALKFNWVYDLGLIYEEMAHVFLDMQQWATAERCLSKANEYAKHNIFLTCKVKQLQRKLFEQTKKVKPLTKLSIRVLGSFEIKYGEQMITLKRKSSLRLLQFFIAHRESKLTKDSIIDGIFPEGSYEAGKNQFYVSLSCLRKALEPDLTSGRDSRYIKQSGEHYFLCMDHIDLDVDEFTRLIQQMGKFSSPKERIEQLRRAELLYRGDYFEGYPYIPFLELERENVRKLYLNVLQELACHFFDQGDEKQGIYYFDKALKKEPYEESSYLEYMRRLIQANLLLHAKKVSELYRKMIGNELGISVQSNLDTIFHRYCLPAATSHKRRY